MSDDKRIDTAAIRAELADVTEGPWEWFGNTKMYDCYLATKHRGRVFVMGFQRWGMGSAQPIFQVTVDGGLGTGVMRSLADLAGGDEVAKKKGLGLPTLGPLFEVDYRRDFVGIGHPDAKFIARSRSLVPELLDEIDRLRDEIKQRDEALDAYNERQDRISAAEGSRT